MFRGILLEQAQKAKTKVKSAEDKRKSQVQGMEGGEGKRYKRVTRQKNLQKRRIA